MTLQLNSCGVLRSGRCACECMNEETRRQSLRRQYERELRHG